MPDSRVENTERDKPKMSLNPFKQPTVKDLVKDVYVKKTLAEKAVKAVRDVQMEALQSTERELGPGDVANCFCEVVEAIFLHGLKNRLTRMVFSEVFGVGGGSGPPTGLNLPRPDFWTLVRNVTHRAGLETINTLDQVSTDVGRCRAWVRLAINDGTLTSSIECITGDQKTLASFYRSSALLQDSELTSVIVRLFGLLSHTRFALPLNVASLNLWQQGPLVLCGLWEPPEDSENVSPVIRGVDVDDYFIKDDERPSEGPEERLPLAKDESREEASFAFSKQRIRSECSVPFEVHQRETLADSLGLPVSIADEIEQALKHDKEKRKIDGRELRLERDPNREAIESESHQVQQLISELKLDTTQGFSQRGEPEDRSSETTANLETDTSGECDSLLTGSTDAYAQPIDDETSSGSATIMSWNNGLVGEGGGGWSSAFTPSSFPESENLGNAASRTPSHVSSKSKVCAEESSFDSILNSYTRHIHSSSSHHIIPVGTPELSSMLAQVYSVKEISAGSVDEKTPVSTPDAESEISEDDDFEIIPAPAKEDSRTLNLLDELGKVPREKGLNQQNFECAGCKCSIGMIFGPYNKCSLDGHLYCTGCMGHGTKAEEHVIPARIVHDWDLRVHPVCSFNKRFLIRYEQEPLLDLRELNPVLYSIVPELATVQGLRRQLGFLRLYLFSCQESAREELKRLVWPHEHLYEHVHLYSTLDLLSVPSGSLQKRLEKAVLFARKHVLSCQLCCQKGFICELCNDPKVIFPFNMDETHFCERCFALYHRHCIAERGQSCIKCERRRMREQRLARQQGLDGDNTEP